MSAETATRTSRAMRSSPALADDPALEDTPFSETEDAMRFRASRAELGVHLEARGPRLRERAGALVEGAGTRGDARAGGARLRAEVRELLLDGVQLASRGIPAAASRLGRG